MESVIPVYGGVDSCPRSVQLGFFGGFGHYKLVYNGTLFGELVTTKIVYNGANISGLDTIFIVSS